MSPIFKRFRDKISELRKKYSVVGRNFSCTGFAVFVAGCVLGSICLIYGESWTFALLYIFLGTVGFVICWLYEIRMPSKQKLKTLPLVSSDVKLLDSKCLLQKIFTEQCKDFMSDAKEKYQILPNNYSCPEVDNKYCLSDYPLTSESIEHNIDSNFKGAITCVELDSSRHVGVCLEQYVTGPPGPHGRSNQKPKEGSSKKTNVRTALNLVRKAFRLSSSDMETVNPQNEPEAGASKQVEQPAPEESATAADATQQDNPSHVERPVDARSPYQNVPSHTVRPVDPTSPYQNVPSHEQVRTERTDFVLSKGLTPRNFERVPLPRETYSQYVHRTQGLQTTYPDYANVTQIRPGHYVPIQGPYFNIKETWHHKRKSVPVSAATAAGNLETPPKRQSSASEYRDKRESAGQFVDQGEGGFQKPRICDNSAQVPPEQNVPVRSEGPYFNIPETWQHNKQKVSDSSDKRKSTGQGQQGKDGKIQEIRPDYENVAQVQLRHKVPIRSEGPYFNVPLTRRHSRQSWQVPSAPPDSPRASESETKPPQIVPRRSFSSTESSDKRTVSTRQTMHETEGGKVQEIHPVAKIRTGLRVPVRPEGPYFNTSSTWHQRVQDSASTTNSAYNGATKTNHFSAGDYPTRNMHSGQVSSKAEEVKRCRSMESVGNLTLSQRNESRPQKQVKQFQQYPGAVESLQSQRSALETKKGSRSLEALDHDESGKKAEFSTPRGASNIQSCRQKSAITERPDSTAFTLENIKRTSMYATGTNVEHETTTGQRKKVERIFPRNPLDCQTPPAQEYHRCQYPIPESDRRNKTRLLSDRASSDAPPLPERKKPRAQKPEAVPERKLCVSSEIEMHPPKEKEMLHGKLHERRMSGGRDIRRTEQLSAPSRSEYGNPLYSEVLPRNQSRDIGRRASDVSNPEVLETNLSKIKRSSMRIRSDSDKQDNDVPPKVQRLSAESPVRGPEGQVHPKVADLAPGFSGKLEDCLQSNTAGFSNQTYIGISEFDRKSSETSRDHLALPSRSEGNLESSEWSDTETENSSVFEEQCTGAEAREESASQIRTKNASTSRSEYMYVTNIGPPQKSYVKRQSSTENRQSTSSTLSPVQIEQFNPLTSDERVIDKDARLSAAEGHSKSRSEYMYVTNIGPAQKSYVRPGSKTENRKSAPSALYPAQSEQLDSSASDEHVIEKESSLLASKDRITNVEKRASSDEACAPAATIQSRHTAVTIETPEEIQYKRMMLIAEINRPQLPTRIPRSDPSESEYSDDTGTDSSVPPEHQENVGKPSKGDLQTEENRAVSRSGYMNVTEIGPPPMSCVKSGPSFIQDPNTMEDDSTAARNEFNNPVYGTVEQSSGGRSSEGARLPEHDDKRKEADVKTPQGSIFYIVGTRKSEAAPGRVGVAQRPASVLGDDPRLLRSEKPSMEGNAAVSRKCETEKQGVKSPDNAVSRSAVGTSFKADVASLKQKNKTPLFRQQLSDPNPRSMSHNSHFASKGVEEPNLNKTRSLSATAAESESSVADRRISKYPGAIPGRKSSQGLGDSRSTTAVPNPLPSPIEVKAPIEVQGVKPTRHGFATLSVPSSPSLSSAPLERVVLPVIGSRVLSSRQQTQFTHRGSPANVSLRPVSPLGSIPLRSPGLVSRALSLSKSETNLSRELSFPSSPRNPVSPLSTLSTRRFSIPSAQRPPEASGRPLTHRHRSKSAVVVLPETPLTLRSDQPSRRNPLDESKRF